MNPLQGLGQAIQHKQFAQLVGLSEARVSQLAAEGLLQSGGTGLQWTQAYCQRLREHAAGVNGDLARERASLAREQRRGIEIKNAVLRGEYASVALLAEVLATASQAVSERFEHLPGRLRKAFPALQPDVIDAVVTVIAEARNEWVRQTAELVVATISVPDEEEAAGLEDEPRTD